MRWLGVAVSGLLPVAALSGLVAALLHKAGMGWTLSICIGVAMVISLLILLLRRLP
jgi:hypothetical protein